LPACVPGNGGTDGKAGNRPDFDETEAEADNGAESAGVAVQIAGQADGTGKPDTEQSPWQPTIRAHVAEEVDDGRTPRQARQRAQDTERQVARRARRQP
jgi:hypothetical protein